jgi:hypothetical protein
MTTALKRSREELFEQLSKLKGNQKSLKEVRKRVAASGIRQDDVLIRRSLRLMNKTILVLKQAMPNLDAQLVGRFAANLLDLWETGQTLDKTLKDLTRSRCPRDREGLRDALIWIDAIQADMGSYWIGEVKKGLPALLRSLDRQERSERKRVAKSSRLIS